MYVSAFHIHPYSQQNILPSTYINNQISVVPTLENYTVQEYKKKLLLELFMVLYNFTDLKVEVSKYVNLRIIYSLIHFRIPLFVVAELGKYVDLRIIYGLIPYRNLDVAIHSIQFGIQ